MTNLRRLEEDDATIGGVLFVFPSGKHKSASWKSESPVADTRALAKDCCTRVVDQLLREGAQDDIDRTNWASCVAACEHIIKEWNALPARAQRILLG